MVLHIRNFSLSQCRRQFYWYHGFTYIGLLLVVAILSLTLSFAGALWSFAQQREKEKQLLFVGNQFRQAITQYYERSPGTVKIYPASLKDLLLDNRFVNTQRHLRRIYRDPITDHKEWGLVLAPQGGIMGVYSQSKDNPIKQDGFVEKFSTFSNQSTYSDWQFIYIPKEIVKK